MARFRYQIVILAVETNLETIEGVYLSNIGGRNRPGHVENTAINRREIEIFKMVKTKAVYILR